LLLPYSSEPAGRCHPRTGDFSQRSVTNSTSSLTNTAAANAPRALAALDLGGGLCLVGLTTNQFSKNNIRSGTSDGRGNYWGAGADSGTFYYGDAAPAAVQTDVTKSRVGTPCFAPSATLFTSYCFGSTEQN
jgi:hypothetical protein